MSVEDWKEKLDEYLIIETDLLSLFIEEENDSAINLEQELKIAKQEWRQARNYFNLVSDPELVEYAVYLLEATEKKYNYLLRKKKNREE